MIGNEVKNVKVIGRREMNMDSNMKDFFNKIDGSYDVKYEQFTKPYFNDAQDFFQKFILTFERLLNAFIRRLF